MRSISSVKEVSLIDLYYWCGGLTDFRIGVYILQISYETFAREFAESRKGSPMFEKGTIMHRKW